MANNTAIDTLNSEQRRRYARNISLAEIGEDGQRRLLSASVIIVGCGALGSVVAQYLAGAGVGKLCLVEFDTVDLSNLQRQILYTTSECGQPKIACLEQRIRALNPEVEVLTVPRPLRTADIETVIAPYDVVVEATDSPMMKHLLPAYASRPGRPCVCGGVSGWQGQVTTVMPGKSQDGYAEMFGNRPDCVGSVTGCGAGGVLGPVAGMVACAQAAEVIKLITGAGEPLVSRLLLIDALAGTTRVLTL